MISKVTMYCGVVLLCLNQVGAKPISNLQSLTQLLEDVRNGPYPASEDAGVEEGITPDNAVYNTDPELPWDRISRNLDQLEKENTMMRLLGEILTSSKRSWSRSKKGNFRSCFGVRLERIGSTSGLGC